MQGLNGWNLEHKFTSDLALDLEVMDFYDYGHYKTNIVIRGIGTTDVFAAKFYGEPNGARNYSLLVNKREQYITRMSDHIH